MPVYVEEQYGSNQGDERGIRRHFLVHEAKGEIDAINATRNYLIANNQLYWPPWDGTAAGFPATGANGVNQLMYMTNVSFVEVHQTDISQNLEKAEYRTMAQYQYRAICPVIDHNLSTETSKVTQSVSSRYYNKDGDGTAGDQAKDYLGCIDPTKDSGDAKGADGFFPRSQFAMIWNPTNMSRFTTEVIEYGRNISKLVGKTNSEVFLADSSDGFAGYDVGELIFLGWTAKVIDQRNDLYEYRYQFGFKEIETVAAGGKVISGITIAPGEKVGGWEHFWIKWLPKKETTPSEFTRPEGEQLAYDKYLEEADFYDLFKAKGLSANPWLVSELCPGFTDAIVPPA